ncbi:MAG: hypothetical protein ACOYOF_06470 [Verrucomicrobiaceae bacterium]
MPTAPNSLSEESDAWLLCLMADANSSISAQLQANLALQEFHRRHYGYILAIQTQFANQFETLEIDADILCNQVFVKAYKNAGSFEDRSNDNKEVGEKLARAWLGKIAVNLGKDALKSVKRSHPGIVLVPMPEDDHFINDLTEDLDDLTPTPRRELEALRAFLDRLKPEEKEILVTYATFAEKKGGGSELPPDVRAALELSTGYERSTIRQKYKRLRERAEAELMPVATTTKHALTHV